MNTDKKELMALLPSSIKNTKEFTPKTKLVIAQLILMNGLDKVKNDGYFFVTNKKLVKELGISEPTIITIMRKLESIGFITRKSGKRGEASEYIINEDCLKSFDNNTKNLSNNTKNLSNKLSENLSNNLSMNLSNNLSNNSENLSNNLSNKLDALTLKINDLTNSNKLLLKKVEVLETLVINLSNKLNANLSTDTDTESDTESETDIEKESLNKINKKEYVYNNLNIKEVGLNNNPTSNENLKEKEETKKEENINEVGFDDNPTSNKETNNSIPTMTVKFKHFLEDCLSRLGDDCEDVSQLNKKTKNLRQWVDNHADNYSESDKDVITQLITDRYEEVKNVIESNTKEYEVLVQDIIEKLKPTEVTEKTNPTPIETKETLMEKLQEFKTSLEKEDNIANAKYNFSMWCKLKDSLIREFNLKSEVEDVIKEINAHMSANKAIPDTFSGEDKESINFNEKTQENGIKPYMLVHVEDEYPF